MNFNLKEYENPDVQRRWDNICESQRETRDIRKRLADKIRERRNIDAYVRIEPHILQREIALLSWILGRKCNPQWRHGWFK